jgi:hypothetical protein
LGARLERNPNEKRRLHEHDQPRGPGAARAATVEDLCNHLLTLPRPDSALLCDFARTFFAKIPRSLAEERSPRSWRR